MVSTCSRPDLFLPDVAFDLTGAHGQVFFRGPPSTELRQVIIGSTDTGNVCESAHGDTRDGWEPSLGEIRGLVTLVRPDTLDERN
jgi:hypothetical protein